MFVPVTKKDFIRLGIRFNSEDIVAESDRLLGLGGQDIAALTRRGYTRDKLEKLRQHRDRLIEALAARRDLSGRKKGALEEEARTLDEGRTALRSGAAALLAAISRRAAGPAAEEEELREKIGNLAEQAGALKGRLDGKSAVVRARLEALKSIISRPDFEPAPEEAPARAEFMAELDDILGRLTELAERKKNLQDAYKDKTAEVNELEGRVYHNLQVLSRVGKAVFQELNDHQHASLYRLRARKDSKREGAACQQPGDAARARPEARPVPAD